MKRISLICIGALVSSVMATPAFAQHVAPAGSAFTASGPASLNGQPCTLTLTGTTNAGGTGGTITGGTNTGPGICPAITIDGGATFTIDTYSGGGLGSATATLNNVTVRVGGTPTCVDTGRPFSAQNTSASTSNIQFNTTIGACSVTANLNANVTVTP